ncbi:MAG: tRNA (adenosine(37)-N6)-dimethylallyltransferase MiaA [Bryobacteraceae bacterium]|nr:tRNA (adenosine(37)-N6)-dimethylallyltransferase MiaA [Bryobacteraceae bacterium]
MHPLVVVLGPTGSGKSALALDVAEWFSGEIVNCDSVQLYRQLDIGSAKTPADQRRGIPHHLVDVLNPEEHFTAGDYARKCREVVTDIKLRNRVPVVVGGTGFYLRAFLYGLPPVPSRDATLRDRLLRRSTASLYRLLQRLDSSAATRIHPNDANKLIRALEVCILTQKHGNPVFNPNPIQALEGFRVWKVGLDPDRDALAARIADRCAQMFASGLVAEVRGILNAGHSPESKALQSIGYRECLQHILGSLSFNQALELTIIASRQYAKRQRTWFRKEPDVFWIQDFGDTQSSLTQTIHHLYSGIK